MHGTPQQFPKQIDISKKGHPFNLPSFSPLFPTNFRRPEAVVEIGKDQIASGIDGAA